VVFRRILDLSNLIAADGFSVLGDNARDSLGGSVSSAGDVNGDGFDEVIIGAALGDDGGENAGEAYVLFGKASGFADVDLTLADLNGADGFAIRGDRAFDFAGTSVSSAGDINGDGFDDVIVGASGGDNGGAQAGEAYVLFGQGSGLADVDLSNLDPAAGFVIQGDAAGDNAGASVSAAGDVNGDGLDDIIVGASQSGDGAGKAYVIFGRGTGLANIDLSALNPAAGFVVQGDAALDNAGVSVSSAGDVNGDGFADVIVGAFRNDDGGSEAGKAYVIFGRASGLANIDLSDFNPAAGFSVQGDQPFDYAGFSVSTAGDVNGDGFDDVIIGAYRGDDGGASAGEAYVIFGEATGLADIDLSVIAAAEGFVIQGDLAFDLAGFSVSSAGDINGDGFDDVVVGAPEGQDGGRAAGEAYAIFGKASGWTNIDLTTLSPADGFVIQGGFPGGAVGRSVSSAGDVNRDGFDDIIVSGGGEGSSGEGAAQVLFGRAALAATVLTDEVDMYTATAGADFVLAMGGADTINGLGGDDVLDGGPGADMLTGGAGDDIYVVDDAGDIVVETAGEGADTVQTSLVAYTLTANVENLTGLIKTGQRLSGNALGNVITAFTGASLLTAETLDDILDGGVGADTLKGGFGDDLYFVNENNYLFSAGDVVEERPDAGTDTIRASSNYTLTDFVENGELLGVANNNLVGNVSANVLIGNAGANILLGGLGNDTLNGRGGADDMRGGQGDDTYVVNDSGDMITEDGGPGAGVDLVRTAIGYALEGNVENGELLGLAAINLVGNEADNTMTGNPGDNILLGGIGLDTLDGGAGADTMRGGASSDRYQVDDAGDVVIEEASAGTDSVHSTVSYMLTANVEKLFLDDGAINGVGNGGDNVIFGNAANNALDGDGGNDVLRGGEGLDTLTGGEGDDSFFYQLASESGPSSTERDRIKDFTFGDRIDLSRVDADTDVFGNQAFALDTDGSFSTSEIRQTVVGPNLLLEMNTDADPTAEMSILLLDSGLLTNADFVL
jgi:Ca2+-binding RTX toxin-like protein